ncbi:dienelactone hydrolase family protein [Candidatus Latescibacterota bacterium]
MTLSQQLSRTDLEDLGPPQDLAPLLPAGASPTLARWELEREALRTRWREHLGQPSFGELDRAPEVIDRFEAPDFSGTLYRQPTGPETRQLVLLMEPRAVRLSPRPAAIIPYYHPDLMAGYNLARHEPTPERPNVHFGRHLVQQGFVVACTEAFPYNTVSEPESDEGFAWWQAAADKLLADHPGWTGIGKLTWDTRCATDLLLSQPDVDLGRTVVMGHSLGGKMAFYAGCLDERLKAIIASDFGIGWDFTNWADPWYHGSRIQAEGFDLAHHQLLALHAPRSFLLIAGEADRPESWQYLQAAQQVYALHGREEAVGCFYHGTGHQPTDESIDAAYRWLAEQFGLDEQPWKV